MNRAGMAENVFEHGHRAVAGPCPSSRLRLGYAKTARLFRVLECSGRGSGRNDEVSALGEQNSVLWKRWKRGGCAALGGGTERVVPEETPQPLGLGADHQFFSADRDRERQLIRGRVCASN